MQRGVNRCCWTRENVPKPIVVSQKAGSVHRISGPFLLPDTPRSSASSLCSCDQNDYRSPRRPPGSRSPALYSSKSKASFEGSRYSSPLTSFDDGPLSTPLPSARKHHDDLYIKGPAESPSPAMDLLEALATQPQGGMVHPSPIRQAVPKAQTADDEELQDLSDSMKQLIQQTDKAFQAVGSALADAKAASDQLAELQSPLSPTFVRPRKAPVPNRVQNDTKLKQSRSTPIIRIPTRKASVVTSKRKNSKRSAKATRKEHNRPRLLGENVSDLFTVKLFNRIEADEMLTPTQLQEIRDKRLSRLQNRHSTDTMRTFETDGSDTPIDSFHLEGLPSRIGAAGLKLPPSPLHETAPSRAQDSTKAVGQPQGLAVPERHSPPPQQTLPPIPASAAREMTVQNLRFPAPPRRNPTRLTAPRRPSIPSTIPEVMVTKTDAAASDDAAPLLPQNSGDYVYLSSTTFTLTMPTIRHGPIRLTRGDVCPEDEPPARITTDETLDWTAFQMAILGGAGEFLADTTDYSRSSRAADEADDLTAWFGGLGIGRPGELVSSPPPESSHPKKRKGGKRAPSASASRSSSSMRRSSSKETKRTTRMPEPSDSDSGSGSTTPHAQTEVSITPVSCTGSSPSSAATVSPAPTTPTATQQPRVQEMVQSSLPIPVAAEYPSGFWNLYVDGNENGSSSSSNSKPPALDVGRFLASQSMGIKRWTVEGHPKLYSKRGLGGPGPLLPSGLRGSGIGSGEELRESMQSLPQSPMFDLVVSRGADGEDYLVPMGYNLGHDLGDFLRWEAENVYAAPTGVVE